MPIKKLTTEACIETYNQCLYSNSEPIPTQKVKSKTYKGIHSQCLYRNSQCQYRNIQLISKWKLITNTYIGNHSNPLYRNSPRPIQEITAMPIQEFTDSTSQCQPGSMSGKNYTSKTTFQPRKKMLILAIRCKQTFARLYVFPIDLFQR